MAESFIISGSLGYPGCVLKLYVKVTKGENVFYLLLNHF